MLTLTPDMLRAAYDYLRKTRPFDRWGLPRGEEVHFTVSLNRTICGAYRGWPNREHEISVSARRVGRTASVMWVVAHEMLHLYQKENGTETPGAQHNAEFRRLAGIVCRWHGFDVMEFGF